MFHLKRVPLHCLAKVSERVLCTSIDKLKWFKYQFSQGNSGSSVSSQSLLGVPFKACSVILLGQSFGAGSAHVY